MLSRKSSNSAILAVISFGVFIAADDLTVVSTMLRQIIFDLEIPLPDGLDRAAWIVNAYLIGYVAVMPFIGRLSDILGRRTIYVAALILFLAGSVWVPLASDLRGFIFGRVLTALGGGAMIPVAMAIVGDIYPPSKRATAMGTLAAIDTAGWVWGPLYGAILVNLLSWRWQFYLNIPLSLIGLLAAWRTLAHLPQPQIRQRIDWLGSGLITAFLILLNIALLGSGDVQSAGSFANLGQRAQSVTWPLYVAAAIMLIGFILLQNTLTNHQAEVGTSKRWDPKTAIQVLFRAPPLIELKLFRLANFTPAILVNFLVGSVLIIAMVNVPLVINVLETEPETAALISGTLLSGMTASMAVMAYFGGRLTARFHYRPVTTVGLGVCAVGFGLMGFDWTVNTPTIRMAGQLVILGAGFGLVIAPLGTAVINAVPPTQRGIAASLVIVLRLIGMSVGLSSLTAWGLHRFGILRIQIELPDLPLSDPAYQQAIVAGLTQVTVRVLTETFLVSAAIALLAILVSLRLRPS